MCSIEIHSTVKTCIVFGLVIAGIFFQSLAIGSSSWSEPVIGVHKGLFYNCLASTCVHVPTRTRGWQHNTAQKLASTALTGSFILLLCASTHIIKVLTCIQFGETIHTAFGAASLIAGSISGALIELSVIIWILGVHDSAYADLGEGVFSAFLAGILLALGGHFANEASKAPYAR